MKNNFKYDIPKSLNIIGEEVFVVNKLYKRKSGIVPIYINSSLFEELFKVKYEWESAKKIISDFCSVTIDKKEAVDLNQIGSAYIDMQGDPTDIALSGNKGSGRAYYFGDMFNLKGEKTQLATSTLPLYNNGKLPLIGAINECMVSNILASEMVPSTFETLAIFDTNETYNFIDEIGEVACGLMIRVDKKDFLYRFTHRFANKKPFSKEELFDIAKKIGILEASKFCGRFLHGAWSLGNLSVGVNMIDFDTAFYVKYRSPQYSYTNKYKTNYFGYEYLGQLKLLDLIIESDLNIDKVKYKEIEDIVISNREEAMPKFFFELMGYDEKLYLKYIKELKSLTTMFERLSRKSFPNYESFYTKEMESQNLSLFDFSKFLRNYKLLDISGKLDVFNSFNLILNKAAAKVDTSISKEVQERINEYFKEDLIFGEDEYKSCIEDVLKFIEHFIELNERLKKDNDINDIEVLIKSFFINEDRKYLVNNEEIRCELQNLYKSGNISAEILNEYINTVINFSKRKYDENKESVAVNMTLFEEGYFYTVINKKGSFHHEFILNEVYDTDLELIVNGELIKSNKKMKNNKIIIKSKENDIKGLADVVDIEITNLEIHPIGELTKYIIQNKFNAQ